MRKVTSALFISMDGVTEAPDQWQFDNFDEDMGKAMDDALAEIDTALLGRVTYQDWASYWPTHTEDDYADFINNAPKYVVSTTLDDVAWGNFAKPTLIKGNLAAEIATLKQQPGKNIGVQGSPTLVRSLVQANLLDELVLMIHPVVVGKGKRLFVEGSDLKRMKLVDSKTTRSGVSLLTYQPDTK